MSGYQHLLSVRGPLLEYVSSIGYTRNINRGFIWFIGQKEKNLKMF